MVAANYRYWQQNGAFWAEEYERRRQATPYFLLQELAWIALIRGLAPCTVLELGCGVGRHLRYLDALDGVAAHGADQSATMLEGCATWADPAWMEQRLTLVEPTGRLPFDNGAFDYVISCEALIHTRPEDIQGRLSEMRRIARRAVIHMEPAPGHHIFVEAHEGSWNHDLVAAYAAQGVTAHALGKVCEAQHLVAAPVAKDWTAGMPSVFLERTRLLERACSPGAAAPETESTEAMSSNENGARRFTTNAVQVGDVSFFMECIQDPWGADDQVVDAVHASAFDEPVSLDLWCDLAKTARPGEMFLDVGAYSGIYALAAAASSSQVRVIAFEPSTITFGRLAQNVLLNNFDTRVFPVNLAAGDSRTNTAFPHRFGIYSLCSGESSSTEDWDHTQPVLIVPLDALLEPTRELPYLNSRSISIWPFSRVAAMKIDVEGAEEMVLQGARRLIARDKPIIIAEVLGDEAAATIARVAQELDYTVQQVPGERNVILAPSGSTVALRQDRDARRIGGREVRSWTVPQG